MRNMWRGRKSEIDTERREETGNTGRKTRARWTRLKEMNGEINTKIRLERQEDKEGDRGKSLKKNKDEIYNNSST